MNRTERHQRDHRLYPLVYTPPHPAVAEDEAIRGAQPRPNRRRRRVGLLLVPTARGRCSAPRAVRAAKRSVYPRATGSPGPRTARRTPIAPSFSSSSGRRRAIEGDIAEEAPLAVARRRAPRGREGLRLGRRHPPPPPPHRLEALRRDERLDLRRHARRHGAVGLEQRQRRSRTGGGGGGARSPSSPSSRRCGAPLNASSSSPASAHARAPRAPPERCVRAAGAAAAAILLVGIWARASAAATAPLLPQHVVLETHRREPFQRHRPADRPPSARRTAAHRLRFGEQTRIARL